MFTETDKKLLFEMGKSSRDILQIERAFNKTNFTLFWERSGKNYSISAAKASEILGRAVFLSGLARSTFHWSAVRLVPEQEGKMVYFDSSEFFRS